MRRRWIHNLLVAVASAGAGAGIVSAGPAPSATVAAATCTPRLLVLSAMPLELDPILARAQADLDHPVMIDNRPFVYGTLEGNAVIMGLTGIAPSNALATTRAALAAFRCGAMPGISGVVFSGTSGGDYIGDVFVPPLWSDDGGTPIATDPAMLAAAEAAPMPALEQSTPPGDPACACEATDTVTVPVTIQHVPTVSFTGVGLTTDPVGGRTLPCVPFGNDVFGCTPCRELDHGTTGQVQALAEQLPPFVDPAFVTGYFSSTSPAGDWVAEDNETAVVAGVAAAAGIPFIGFRSASDGGGDPLHLPGFPVEFFVYRQLAANNAAAMTLAFLGEWAATH